MRSDAFAGVERYVCDVAAGLAARDWSVRVIGGDVDLMRRHLPSEVAHVSARTTTQVLARLLEAGTVDLVHAHMTAAELAAVLSRPRTGSRVVATRHFAGPRGRIPAVRASGRLLAKGIDVEIAISQFVAQEVGGAPRVLHHGVQDAEASDLKPKAILMLQRLQAEKDTATAVRAFARSGLASDGWRLLIAGGGVLEGPLRELVGSFGLSSVVDFLGFVEDAARLRRQASIFLATTPREGFGLSLAEAMAAGLPVVAADGGAHPEILDGCGLLFPPGDALACADALRRLAADPVERQCWGTKARARQQRALSVRGHVDRLEQIYVDVLASA